MREFSQAPYILSKEPCILSKEPHILSKEPHILSKDPYILSNEPTRREEEQCRDEISQKVVVDSFHILQRRGGGLGSRPIFKKINEPYAPS